MTELYLCTHDGGSRARTDRQTDRQTHSSIQIPMITLPSHRLLPTLIERTTLSGIHLLSVAAARVASGPPSNINTVAECTRTHTTHDCDILHYRVIGLTPMAVGLSQSLAQQSETVSRISSGTRQSVLTLSDVY